MIIQLIGGLFLIYLGIKTVLTKPSVKEASTKKLKNLTSDYASTFFLTITNPMTILSFVAVFAGLGLAGAHAIYSQGLLLVAGVILGSLSWWLILAFFVADILRHRVNAVWLKSIAFLSGAILMVFGFFALISAIKLM